MMERISDKLYEIADNMGYLVLIISSIMAALILTWYYGFYHPSIIGIYQSMSCAELKDMLINSAEGLGPIFRGEYARCMG